MPSMKPSFFMPLVLLVLTACSNPPPIHTATAVDLERFMGDWYVIANIPTFIETNAYNAIESYRMAQDGTVATTFSFREGGFEGPRKAYHPTGYLIDRQSNAVWGMQFIWPIKSDYRIIFVNEAYDQTIIGRIHRDYVWLMARTPQISDADYQGFLQLITEAGYDASKVRKVPQQWN
ncbi:MAG: lipocalin family protein [Nitrospira sp.]|nr:lipocalin family protein [Nitrospira sp.]MBP0124018.1 lipocalin family protein [Nitrospira sp.]MBP0127268.1 lipocalin family protein [Nitrospira sp.]MBP0129802.1 lipocalin family protein [Nitrospira sp.]MBP0130198.1 lipocalin family protein [Nitrospira sp.]